MPIDHVEQLQSFVEWLEDCIKNQKPGSRRHAELQLAWHHAMDAHNLILKGRLTPDDVIWAHKEVDDELE